MSRAGRSLTTNLRSLPRSPPLAAMHATPLVPRLDDQVIRGLAHAGQYNLFDVDANPATAARLHRQARDLGVTAPLARVVLRRIVRGAVDGNSRIALNVFELHRVRHHAHDHLAPRELHLDAADAWRAVSAQGRQRLVAVSVEQLTHLFRKDGIGRRYIAPPAHALNGGIRSRLRCRRAG